MEMQINPYYRNHILGSKNITKGLTLLILLIAAIVAKIALLKILPDKYLLDSNHIIGICNGANGYGDKAYEFAASVFTPLVKIFHINNARTGSLILGLILNPILLLVLYKRLPNKIRFYDCVFMFLLVFLLNIYVFNISKDLVQFFIDLIAVFFILKIKNKKVQTLLVSFTFILFSLLFRGYLAIVAYIYIYIKLFKDKQFDRTCFILFTISLFILITACLYHFDKALFDNVFNSRDITNKNRLDSSNAQTIINHLITKEGYLYEILNYVINLFRLIFPIELVLQGNILYLFFFIFNIIIIVTLFLERRCIKSNNILNSIVTLFISFVLVFALFEPDFGSFLRHFVPIAFVTISTVLYLPLRSKLYGYKKRNT